MHNVNCRPKAEPLDHPQPGIKEKLPKVGVTDRLTDLWMTVCLCNVQPFFTPLADWRAHPSHLKTPAPVGFAGFHVWRTDRASFLATPWPSSHPWPYGSLGRDRLCRGGGGRKAAQGERLMLMFLTLSEINKHIKLQLPAQPIRSDSKISPQCSPQVHYFFWDMSSMYTNPALSQLTTLPLDFSWSFTAL